MKKRLFVILSIVHVIWWIVFLLISIFAKFTYQAPNADPLDFALSKEMYNVFILAALAGIVNAVVLHVSLDDFFLDSKAENKRKRITAFCVALLTTVLFYLALVMFFLVNTDVVLIMPIIWFVCLLFCIVLLMLPPNRKN